MVFVLEATTLGLREGLAPVRGHTRVHGRVRSPSRARRSGARSRPRPASRSPPPPAAPGFPSPGPPSPALAPQGPRPQRRHFGHIPVMETFTLSSRCRPVSSPGAVCGEAPWPLVSGKLRVLFISPLRRGRSCAFEVLSRGPGSVPERAGRGFEKSERLLPPSLQPPLPAPHTHRPALPRGPPLVPPDLRPVSRPWRHRKAMLPVTAPPVLTPANERVAISLCRVLPHSLPMP